VSEGGGEMTVDTIITYPDGSELLTTGRGIEKIKLMDSRV